TPTTPHFPPSLHDALPILLSHYVPTQLVNRPKSGFGVPIGTWLRGPLRKWAEDLLSEAQMRQDAFFNPMPVRQAWIEERVLPHRSEEHTSELQSPYDLVCR